MIRPLARCFAMLLLAASCVSELICGSEGIFSFESVCTDKCPTNTVLSTGICSADPSCSKGYVKEGKYFCEKCTKATATLFSDLGFCAESGEVKCGLQIVNYTGSVISAREVYLNLTCIDNLQVASMDHTLKLFMPRYSVWIYRKISSTEYYRYLSFVGFLQMQDSSGGVFYFELKNDEDNSRDDVYHIQLELLSAEYVIVETLHTLYRAPFINFSIAPGPDHLIVQHVDIRSEEGMSISISNELDTVFEDSVYTYNDMKLQVKWRSDFMCLHMSVPDIDKGACSAVEFKPAETEILPLKQPVAELEPPSYEETSRQASVERYHSSLVLALSSMVAFMLFATLSVHSTEDIHFETRQASGLGYRVFMLLVYLQIVLAAVYLFDFLHLSVRFTAAYASYKILVTGVNYMLYRSTRPLDPLLRLYFVASIYLCFQVATSIVLWTDSVKGEHLWMAAAIFGFDMTSFALARLYTVRMFDEKNSSKLHKYSQWYLFFD